ncbi:MAG: hypothetical protein ABIN00_07665 [candidate division WOR-3 bacterium]
MKKRLTGIFMKSKIVILILFFSLTILSNETYLEKLVLEGDYYRAVEEFKRVYFISGDEKDCRYYLKIGSLYALSGYDTFSFKYLDLLSEVDLSEECFLYDGLVRSFLSFKRGDFYSAIFEIEDFQDQGLDTLKILLELINKSVKKEKLEIPDFLDDSIKNDLKSYEKMRLKSPELSMILSSLVPGLGELYSGNVSMAFRDFTITTFSNILLVYSFLKNPQSFYIDRFEFSKEFFKSRDYFLTLFIYSSLVTRFQNGSKNNAYKLAEKKNEEIQKKYLTRLYYLIENIYRKKIVNFVLNQ